MTRRVECTCVLCQEWAEVAACRSKVYRRTRSPRPCIAFGAMPYPNRQGRVAPFSKDELLRDVREIAFGAVYDLPPNREYNWRISPTFVLAELGLGSPPVIGGMAGTIYRRGWGFPIHHGDGLFQQHELRPAIRLANALDRSASEHATGLRLPAPLDYLPQAILGFRADLRITVEPDRPALRWLAVQAVRDGSVVNNRPLAATVSPCAGDLVGVYPIAGTEYASYLDIRRDDAEENEPLVRMRVPRTPVWLVQLGEHVEAGQQLFYFSEPRHLSHRDWDEVEKELGLTTEWFLEEVWHAAGFSHLGYACWSSGYVVEQAEQAVRGWIDMRELLPFLREDGLIVCPPIDRQDAESDESLIFQSWDGGLGFDFLNSPQRSRHLNRMREQAAVEQRKSDKAEMVEVSQE